MVAPLIIAGLRFIAGAALSSAVESGGEGSEQSVDESKELLDYTDKLAKQVEEGAEKGLENAAAIVHAEIVGAIREVGAVASSSLVNSVTVGSMLSTTDSVTMMVGSTSPYAVFVEDGRSPGAKQPPVEAIYQWMVNKGLEANYRAAYLIARKIGERGIPPKNPFATGVARAESQIQQQIELDITEILEG